MIHRRLLLMAAVSLLLVAGICPPDVPPDPEWQPEQFRPIGGKDYALPAGLTAKTIVGWDDEIENPAAEYPLMFLVQNTTGSRIDAKLPEGLVFYPRNLEDYMFVILVKEFGFTVPPNQDTTLLLPTYGCNEDKDEPDDEGYYDIDIQLWEKGFTDIFEILTTKSLATFDDFDVVQDAIYEYTFTQDLTDSIIDALEALP